jgi:predicted RNA-binding Zn ribbon-like protein
MSASSYDFESGDLSLDYANTKDWHGSPEAVETLNSYEDIVNWGKDAGLITTALAHQMLKQAAEQPEMASSAYDLAIQLREALYHIFSNHYAGKPISESDLTVLNSMARQAMAGQRLVHKDGGLRWEWAPGMHGINLILWPVARAAAELLTSDRASRVRECEDDRGCGYLFIDQSKNRSRRWCSMEGCGNRAKAKRHYARLQS